MDTPICLSLATGDRLIRVKDDRVVDFNPDVTQTRINLEVRDKFLRRRASLRVAASRSLVHGPSKGRGSSRVAKKIGVVSESSLPPLLREKMVMFVSHLKTVIRQRLLKSGGVELNPGPLQGKMDLMPRPLNMVNQTSQQI